MVKVFKPKSAPKHMALPPKNNNELLFRSIIDTFTRGRKCCKICGDEDDLRKVQFVNHPDAYFCDVCYNIQINM